MPMLNNPSFLPTLPTRHHVQRDTSKSRAQNGSNTTPSHTRLSPDGYTLTQLRALKEYYMWQKLLAGDRDTL